MIAIFDAIYAYIVDLIALIVEIIAENFISAIFVEIKSLLPVCSVHMYLIIDINLKNNHQKQLFYKHMWKDDLVL